jgi:hypothetical protein
MIQKIIKNTTNANIFINEAGVRIPANGQHIIDPTVYYLWAKQETQAELASYTSAGDIIINNGLIDLSASDGLRFLLHPERITVQETGVDITRVVTTINVTGNASVTDNGNGKVTIDVGTGSGSGPVFENTMYWANCVCHCDGVMFSDFEALVDYTYNGITVGDC